MKRSSILVALILVAVPSASLWAADHLRLNPRLDFMKNGQQGELIYGDHMEDGAAPGKVNYIVFFGEFCYNSKRQAKTTVDLYNEYKGRVHFVIVDFEYGWSAVQNKLVVKYFSGNIPQVVILDGAGRPVFNYIGQAGVATLRKWLNAALEYPKLLTEVDHPMDHPGEKVTNEVMHNPFSILHQRLCHCNTSY